MTTAKAQAILSFYRYYCVFPVLVTVFCGWQGCLAGADITVGLMAIKILTNAFTLFIIISFRSPALYYYYNLHISKLSLLGGFCVIDFILFSVVLWLALMIR